MKRAIIIFTRVPEPGQTKTRMMPALSAKGCARLHTCFLEDIKRECGKVEGKLFVCFTPDEGRERLYPVFGRGEYYISQRGSGLGERMYQAVREVLGPTRDGGYYLVGMKKPQRAVFDVEGYGQGSVLRDTMYRLKTAGCRVGLTETLWDMDVYQDLQGYRQRMREDKRLQETSTGRYLARTSRISIIVPVYNEEKTIVQMQDQLEPLRGKCEILFVDGGSTDRTMEGIRPWVKVIHSQKGRARQMNTGAMESHGDILFFLHCDSELPPSPLAEIRRVMKDHSAGCFGIAFHSSNFFMFTCRVISNHRIKDRRVMFGDQGIFVDRSLFFDAGMFPEIPVMEDYQFSLTLKERGVKLGMTGRRIYTSDRRFPKGTLPKLKLMWNMNRLRKMYRDQVPIEQIDRMYRDVR